VFVAMSSTASNTSPRILVIRRRYLGDIVLLGSFFRNLRLHWPDATIAALVETAYSDVLTLNPDVHQVFHLPQKTAGIRAWLLLARDLRRTRFTHVFDLDNADKTAVLARISGAPFRAALLHEGIRPRLTGFYTTTHTDSAALHETRPITEFYLSLLSTAGVPVQTREIRLNPRPADVAAMRTLLVERTSGKRPRLLLHPGSRSSWRQWPAARFAAVLDALHARALCDVCLIGGPADDESINEILRHTRSTPARFAPLPVPAFCALASQFDLMLCHDSGPMHLAAAVGTPVIALLGSQNARVFPPHGPGHNLLQAPLPCTTCVSPDICAPGDSYHNHCVRRISEETVLAAIETRLSTPVSSKTPA
jgi:ADP-heptose:LPS heptosyltransferase